MPTPPKTLDAVTTNALHRRCEEAGGRRCAEVRRKGAACRDRHHRARPSGGRGWRCAVLMDSAPRAVADVDRCACGAVMEQVGRSSFTRSVFLLATLVLGTSTCLSATQAEVAALDGRHYYLMEPSLCRANAPGRPRIRSWTDHIEIRGNGIAVWGQVCNDAPDVRPLRHEDIKISRDRSFIVLGGRRYTHGLVPPRLCQAGQWCPVE